MNAKKLADMFADWLPMDSPERAANFARWANGAQRVGVGDSYTSGPAIFRTYHGTGSDIDAINPKKLTDKEGRRRGLGLGAGKFYMSGSPEAASGYAMSAPERRLGKNPSVMPLDVRFSNPIEEDEYYRMFKELSGGRELYSSELAQKERDALISKLDKKLKNDGVDGIVKIYRDPSGNIAEIGQVATLGGGGNVKSIFNRGTYDPNDPNILKSIAPYAIAGGGLMSALSPSDAAAIESIRQKDAPLEEAWNPVEAFGGGLGGGLRAALAGIIPDGVTDWAISGLMSGGK